MSFWGDAILTVNYLCNHVPTSTLPDNVAPYEEMEHVKPNLSHLWVWGCQCFVAIPLELCTKGGPHRFEAIFVGYEDNQLGWHVRDLHGKYHFSHDVIFNELVPGHSSSHHKTPPTTVPSPSLVIPPPLPTTSSHPLPSSSPPPTPRPPRHITCTSKGQAFKEVIQIRDDRLAG